jgi:putative transposase
MPWKETHVVDTRVEFVMRALREEKGFRELCREYGVSPKTGYKWKRRFLEEGLQGLEDLSRKPLGSPSQIAEDVLCEIIRIKKDHSPWGPLKIREVYARKHRHGELPSLSTFKRVLEKAGLVHKRRPRKQDACGRIENRIVPEGPNELWTTDFKGWWHTHNGERCEPLTVRDEYSRFVLCASALEDAKSLTVRREFERLFETYGLPRAIRSDNGPPFASVHAPLGLSRLSAWWVALGINLDRIAPGRPHQNGAHERMHRDIALELESCPETDLRGQRAALDTWRQTFNLERPHEALGMRVPGDLYQRSERYFPTQPEDILYPAGFLPRKVSSTGSVAIEGVKVRVSSAIAGWHVGLKPSAPEGYLVWFGPLCLGALDLRTEAFHAADKFPH